MLCAHKNALVIARYLSNQQNTWDYVSNWVCMGVVVCVCVWVCVYNKNGDGKLGRLKKKNMHIFIILRDLCVVISHPKTNKHKQTKTKGNICSS